VVPSSDTIRDIRIVPLLSFNIIDDDIVKLGLSIPTTIGVDLVVKGKDRVTTTTFRNGVFGFMLGPGLLLQIKGVEIVKRNASVV